jgi:hypothetical protein
MTAAELAVYLPFFEAGIDEPGSRWKAEMGLAV